MKYIGLFSGDFFNTKEDADNAGECCVNVKEEDERLRRDAAYNEWHFLQLAKCVTCFGCPRSNR